MRPTEKAIGARAAFGALREFFDFSPLWLKTGGAFAVLAVCALAVFALVNAELRLNDQGFAFNTSLITRERAEPRATPVAPSLNPLSQDEINELVNARVAREIERLRNIEDQRETAIINAGVNQTSTNRNQVSPPVVAPRENASRRRNSTPQVSSERPQLVRRETTRDSEPPRLYDLLGELQ